MVLAFRSIMEDKDIIKEFDLTKPEKIFKETVDSISKTIEAKLEQMAEPPRRYCSVMSPYCHVMWPYCCVTLSYCCVT